MTFPLMIILLLAVLLAVMLYNFYQEQRYRRQIRRQFGHSDHDALLGSQTQSVRDGQYLTGKRKIAGEQESAAPVVAKVAEFGKVQPELAEETLLRKARFGKAACTTYRRRTFRAFAHGAYHAVFAD